MECSTTSSPCVQTVVERGGCATHSPVGCSYFPVLGVSSVSERDMMGVLFNTRQGNRGTTPRVFLLKSETRSDSK